MCQLLQTIPKKGNQRTAAPELLSYLNLINSSICWKENLNLSINFLQYKSHFSHRSGFFCSFLLEHLFHPTCLPVADFVFVFFCWFLIILFVNQRSISVIPLLSVVVILL